MTLLFSECARFLFGAAEKIVESREPVEPSDFFTQAFGPQQIANSSSGPDYAKFNATAGKLIVQLVQHVRTGEVDIRRRRQITYHQMDDRLFSFKTSRHGLEHRIGIDVKQRGLGTESQHPW